MSLSVLIERCSHCDEHGVSVRHDEGKYTRYAEGIAEAVGKHFNRSISSEVALVGGEGPKGSKRRPKLGALEVFLLCPDGERVLVFSKLQDKRWPTTAEVLRRLVDLTKVDVQLNISGHVLAAADGSTRRDVSPQREGQLDRRVKLKPLPHVEVVCAHTASDMEWTLCADSRGVVRTTLFPGAFTLHFPAASGYDEITPDSFSVPGDVTPVRVEVVTTMKKKVTFYVLDQFGSAVEGYVFKIWGHHGEGSTVLQTLTTRQDGKVRTTLCRGEFVAYHGLSEVHRLEGAAAPPASTAPFLDSAFMPLRQDFEVAKTEIPQFFRLNVRRVKFDVELLLTTRCGEPVRNLAAEMQPVTTSAEYRETLLGPADEPVRGRTSEIGLLRMNLPAGKHLLTLSPAADEPYEALRATVEVSEDGGFDPQRLQAGTKTRDVELYLITPDGEPAVDVAFRLASESGKPVELRSDEAGVAVAAMELLAPYVFEVPESNAPQEYMPQRFAFQTDRLTVTAVVARSVFGAVSDERVVLLLDISGSMGSYLEELKRAMTELFVKQFRYSRRFFNIVVYSTQIVAWRDELVPATDENIESALRFIGPLCAGGGTDAVQAVEVALSYRQVEAVYLVSDGKNELSEQALQRISLLYYSHTGRPRLHTVAINCMPRRRAWKSLAAVSLSTRALFRPICLAQDLADADSGHGALLPVTREPDEYSVPLLSVS